MLWLAGTIAFSLLVFGLVLPLPSRRAQAIFGLLCGLGVSMTFFVDMAYYRYFTDFPTLSQLGQLGQLGKVGGSVRSAVRLTDLLLFIDLPFYLWACREKHPFSQKRLVPSLVILAVALVCAISTDFVQTPQQRSIGENRFKNYAVAREFGVPLYHALDIQYELTRAWRLSGQLDEPLAALPLAKASLRSIQIQTEFTGAAEGMNVMVVLLESIQTFALDTEINGQQVMPFLNEYKDKCLYFPRMYDQTNHASSSDGEFVLANSLHPAAQGTTAFVYQNNDYQSIPNLLKKAGYHSVYFGYYDGAFWNARTMMQRYGFTEALFAPFGAPAKPEERIGWGLADYGMLVRAYSLLAERKKPFYSVIHCSMGHHPFRELKPEQKELKLPPDLEGTMVGDYLQMCRFRDNNLRAFFSQYEKLEMAKNTVVVLTGDHGTPLTPLQLQPLLKNSKLPLKVAWAAEQSVPVFIRIPGTKGHTFSHPVGQIDFAPTIFHILGVEPDRPVFLGQNMLNRSGGIYYRKSAYALQNNILVSVLDQTAHSLETEESLPYSEHKQMAEDAVKQWKISDELLDYNLIPKIREAWSDSTSQ